jgi:hypothetical protein
LYSREKNKATNKSDQEQSPLQSNNYPLASLIYRAKIFLGRQLDIESIQVEKVTAD